MPAHAYDFLLYGANGYTGTLIARLATTYGLKPLLAGRNPQALEALARETGYDYRVFSLDNREALDKALAEVPMVLHAAGPFIRTSTPMLDACLRLGKHYTDITGEIAVFEQARRRSEEGLLAGIMIMPGVGFDVVPTDCIARFLHQRLPDARELRLAFTGTGSRMSRGTSTTMALGAGEPGAMRKDGKIIPVPLGHAAMTVDFGLKKRFVMAIPWGDVSTAYTTTGIPNIETFTAVSPKTYSKLKYQRWYNWLLRTSFVRKRLLKRIQAAPAGPSDQERADNKSLVWGWVRNAAGQTAEARLQGPEGYSLTAHSALLIARKIRDGQWKPGYQTPAGCYGADLVLEIPGTTRELVSS